MSDTVAFVLGSAARRAVLARLASGPASGRCIVDACDASESAVYDGLARLAEHDLATEADDGTWHLTGAGQLVAAAVQRCGRVDDIVASAPEYWATHDATSLPERFLRSIDRLRSCSVVSSPQEDPYRVARRTEAAIREGDTVAVVAPVYSDRHAEAFVESDAADCRLVMTPEMVERILRDDPAGPASDPEELSIRVQPASVSITLTDRELFLSLPECAGPLDTDTAVVADSAIALDWGRELFEHYWSRGTPVQEWVANQLPAVAADSEHAPSRPDDA